MKWILCSFLLLHSMYFSLNAQNVAINTDGSAPDSSAILDIKSGSKGILVPRMIYLQRINLIRPATGLMVFQTDDVTPYNPMGFYFNGGTPAQPVWRHINMETGTKETYFGNASFVVPQGITRIYFEAVGAGGGRGGYSPKEVATGNYYFGGTGGGGGFAKGFIKVSPGQTINIVVGTAGTNGINGPGNTDGTAGGNTTISIGASVVVTVEGGGAGLKGIAPAVGSYGFGGGYSTNPASVYLDFGYFGTNGTAGITTTFIDLTEFGICGFTPFSGERNFMISQIVSLEPNFHSFFTCPNYGKGGGVSSAVGGYVVISY